MATHEVLNQPPPRVGYNAYSEHPALVEAVVRHGAAWADDELGDIGAKAGSEEALEWGRLANAHPPELHSHDRFGNRSDTVEYHPAYHRLMATAIGHGLHAAPWGDDRPGAHVARAAKVVVWGPVDYGHTCPISMTYSVLPSLQHHAELAAELLPGLASTRYDPRPLPVTAKEGMTMGMAMTEKQGGSDVRANTTRAEPQGGDEYLLTGHKWFCSAPMSDAFLVLAQAPSGLTCFYLPRRLEDGSANPFFLQRLKDKVGDRSNASAEVEFEGTWARRVGEEGRGVRTIIEMVAHTRLDCSLGAAAQMRHGAVTAVHHARHRAAFGKALAEQPLMVAVLADLALESEAATTAALWLAAAHDPALANEHSRALRRVATPVLKYWLCKRAPAHAAEAVECLGGNGYVEESAMARLFRQSPLNGLWEGSGNVQCLDVLRALRTSPESGDALLTELREAAGVSDAYDAGLAGVERELGHQIPEMAARRVVGRWATLLIASLLLRYAPEAVASAFVAARIGSPAAAYGALPDGIDVDALLERALPR